MRIPRGKRRTTKPDIFISHSSKDSKAASRLALNLNFCGVDVWLDKWELQVGQSLTDELAKAIDESRYVGILITENYNKTVWTKAEYKKAIAREQKEDRIVMLPIIIGEAEIPNFLEDKIHIDLRKSFYTGLAQLSGMVHEISEFRLNRALEDYEPNSVLELWNIFESVGFDPYVVFGEDDYDEILKYGGTEVHHNYAHFSPYEILESKVVSPHVKKLIGEFT